VIRGCTKVYLYYCQRKEAGNWRTSDVLVFNPSQAEARELEMKSNDVLSKQSIRHLYLPLQMGKFHPLIHIAVASFWSKLYTMRRHGREDFDGPAPPWQRHGNLAPTLTPLASEKSGNVARGNRDTGQM